MGHDVVVVVLCALWLPGCLLFVTWLNALVHASLLPGRPSHKTPH